jgi:hypothetical protein
MAPLVVGALRRAAPGFLSVIIAGAIATPAWSQIGAPDSIFDYVLGDYSAYQIGCFGPCECAVQAFPLSGTFRLRKTGVDPLYTHYAVEALQATFLRGGQHVAVSGAGEYRIGGEVALTHQLVLDLVIDGAPARRFDSGVVAGGSTFPSIGIQVAANGFACYDTVGAIAAKPVTASVPVPPGSSIGLSAVPNPFGTDTEIRFVLGSRAPVDVRIFDSSGREVRAMARGIWLDAGPQALPWDGHLADASRAKSGLYFARVRWAGREWAARIVKLE